MIRSMNNIINNNDNNEWESDIPPETFWETESDYQRETKLNRILNNNILPIDDFDSYHNYQTESDSIDDIIDDRVNFQFLQQKISNNSISRCRNSDR